MLLRSGVQRALTLAIGGLAVVAMSTAAAGAVSHATTATVVSSVENAKLGTILVAGTTVYTLKPSKTGCTAACLRKWPPVLLPHGTKRATAGTGVDAAKLGTAKTAKGALQITYAGKRLYWSAKDRASGQVHGNSVNKWGRWSTVAASTTPSAAAATTAPGPTTAPPGTEAPATAPPAGAAPQTSPPANTPPVTAPQTSPPATAPPQTSPPATQPPPTEPKTDPPGNGGVGF